MIADSSKPNGLYCAISGNEPSSIALLKPVTNARLLCCNFENLYEKSKSETQGQTTETLLRSMFLNVSALITLNIFIKKNLIYTMDNVRGDYLGPPHGTTPAAVIANKYKGLVP